MPTANLTASLQWEYHDHRGRECETDIQIDYTCNADGVIDLGQQHTGADLDESEWDRVADHIEAEIAPEAYAEWLADMDGERGQ